MVAVTHLALLGVKIQDPAFWGHIRRMRKQSSCAAAFADGGIWLHKLSDDQFMQPGICVEASQIPLIAEQNLRFCSRSSASSASEWKGKMSIKIGILGYGNLGRGVECAIKQNPDMELAAVFTRRDPKQVSILTKTASVCQVSEAAAWKDRIDVMILCGGSATDLPVQTPEYAKLFNVVDSFDTHANIPKHFEKVDTSAKAAGKVGIISVGWDPGMFSLNRMYASAILPKGKDYTFWGKGVSQGHSDAIRRIAGVKDAKQYTIPVEAALEAVREGKNPELSTREKHNRECFVVLEEGADAAKVEQEIKTMPNYFADYDTTVHFISEEELKRDHSGIPHGGFVLRSGKTGWEEENSHLIEYRLKLDSNPEFTSCVIAAYARAAFRLYKEGQTGAKTVFDIPPAYLSAMSGEELRASML